VSTVLVNGAAGFVARHLLAALRARDADRVAGADMRAVPAPNCDSWYAADLADPEAVRHVVAIVRPSSVFHLVGAFRGSDEMIRSSNVESARALLDAVCAEAPAARVVLVGSSAEYGVAPLSEQPVRESFEGAPPGAYGRAKREVTALAVRYARDRGVRVSVARPSNVIGAGIPDSLVVGAIVHRLRAALAGPPPRSMRIGATSAIRDFVAAEDVAAGLVRVAERGAVGEAYNLCSGEGHSVADVLDRLLALAAAPVTVLRDDALVRAGEVDAMVCSWEKASRDLGWRPAISLDASLRSAWEFSAAVAGAA
jgi:GDP-4-dehydro-6-deoxy-D-mannose reductase